MYNGEEKNSWSRNLVPISGRYLCSMQGSMCRIRTLEGAYPPSKGRLSCKGYKKGSTWLGLRQFRDTWIINMKWEYEIKLNKERKTHEMKLQIDIQGSHYGEWTS